MATNQRLNDRKHDKPVKAGDDLTVIKATLAYKREAEDAKRERMDKNRANMGVYLTQGDWTHKQEGQSREFLPKTAVAVEQMAAFVERALIQFGDWYSVELGKSGQSPLEPHQIRNLMNCYLNKLQDGFNKTIPFAIRLSDVIKVGLLEALPIFKVHGMKVTGRSFYTERGTKFIEQDGFILPQDTVSLKTRTSAIWRLCVDIVRPVDYFPDPTGRGLYEIHRVERDLHDVKELAKQGIYDKRIVDMIEEDFADDDENYRKARTRNQRPAEPPSFRKRVVIDECWGDILTSKGDLVKRGALWAVANDKYLIREPEDNPNWHGESPFVSAPLVRVPDSVWHKALYDNGAPLNIALNEMFNLMLDGGMASVWGTKQIRIGMLEDPRQVSGGVPQGATLAVKDELPHGAKVLEQLTEGEIPQDAMAIYSLLDNEFNVAVLSNDLKMGALPDKDVKATEVVEIRESQAVTLDAISGKIESMLVAETLRKSWLTILQNADDLDSEEVVNAIGPRAALMLARMTPAERFAAFAGCCAFKVHGLTATLSRAREFQRHMAMWQAISTNPILLQAYYKKFSPDKELNFIMKSLNINPENLEMSDEELMQLEQRTKELPFFQNMANPGGNAQGQPLAPDGSGAEVPAEISQQANPMTGMV